MPAPDVFVSYASADRAAVERIVAVLEAEGLVVWWDRNIAAGHAFDRDIEAALDAAGSVLVVWSAASVDSDWVRTEAAEGLDRGVLVPVALGDVRPPLAFRRLQTLRLDPGSDAAPVAVLAAVKRVVSPRSRPDDAGPAPAPRAALRSRPLVALATDAPGDPDPGTASLGRFLDNELSGYLAMWVRGDLAARPDEADYLLKLHIAADDRQRRISCRLECRASGRRQQVSATAAVALTLTEQANLAGALFRWADRAILEDLRSRLVALPPGDLDYWGLVNQTTLPDVITGRQSLKRAMEMAPERGLAYTLFARLSIIGRASQLIPRDEISLEEIRALARRGVELDPMNALALREASYVLALIGEPESALALGEEAGRLFPPYADVTTFALVRLGRGAEAVQVLNAHGRWGLPVIPADWTVYAEAYAVQAAYAEVEAVARRGILRAGTQEMVLRAHYANALARLGRREEALEQWRLARELAPGLTAEAWQRGWSRQMARPELTDAVAGGLLTLEQG